MPNFALRWPVDLLLAALLFSLSSTKTFADVVSDVVTLTDTAGFYNLTGTLTETQETGMVQLKVPGVVIPLNPSGPDADSDFLEISAFNIGLASDNDGTEPDTGEFATFTLKISVSSDVFYPAYPYPGCTSGISDCLNVVDWAGKIFSGNIIETPGGVDMADPNMPPNIIIPQLVAVFGANENNGKANSDALGIDPFVISLNSDDDTASGPDVGESFSDTFTVQVLSDCASLPPTSSTRTCVEPVPEPSLFLPLAGGLALGAFRKRRRKA
jgi:hypothetical protein